MKILKFALAISAVLWSCTVLGSDLQAQKTQIESSYKSDLAVCMEFAKNEQAGCKKEAQVQRQSAYQKLWSQHNSNEPLPVYQGDLASQKKQIEADYQLMLSVCTQLDKATQSACKTEATNRKKASLKVAMDVPGKSSKPEACNHCGVVTQIVEVDKPGEGSWIGKVGGAAVGAGLGSLVGKGTGRTVAIVAGALGGAYAGNKVEGKMNEKKFYEVTVKLDDGAKQTITYDNAAHGYKVGDKVRLENQQLVKR
ncbi:glycine zipper 2TM domain-containing protein [Chitinibacter bivalviorum]|uniref:Glycine zipper 2TM domain-containing protein n=1 Tax=Chitinibacter bivalviorum TaxID=2739434 RepID=A0A7H9BK94_9NEIS|nr:glycine zipper 2TM domain-containing protein [Chitinibacter bivalviorum]QLG89080.1 glycine zipper 2TM domain-containing protein [Chitinibacter bivalviorum]